MTVRDCETWRICAPRCSHSSAGVRPEKGGTRPWPRRAPGLRWDHDIRRPRALQGLTMGPMRMMGTLGVTATLTVFVWASRTWIPSTGGAPGVAWARMA